MDKKISELREFYSLATLSKSELHENPMVQFGQWFEAARKAEIKEPNAMSLATVSAQGMPSVRTILLKEIEEDGLIFYTNYNSHKAQEIANNPAVALCFLWKEIERQVRIEGRAEKISVEQSLKYFQSRPKASQIGAWVSMQSEVLEDRNILESKKALLEAEYADLDVLPIPPFWGGYKIKPTAIEFWQGRPSRLHDRFRYSKDQDKWRVDRLNP